MGLRKVIVKLCRVSFFNYVDQILPIIDHLPTPEIDIREEIYLLLRIRKNLHNVEISSTYHTYLPCLVNVVCERPLRQHFFKKNLKDNMVCV